MMIHGRCCGQLLSHRQLVFGGTAREARKGIAGAGRYRCHDDDTIGSYDLLLLLSGCIFWVDQWLFNEIWKGQVATRFFLKQSGLREKSRKEVASEVRSTANIVVLCFAVCKDRPASLLMRAREAPNDKI